MSANELASRSALEDAWTIQIEASKVGFDWSHVADVIAKVREELEEIEEALAAKDKEHAKTELGDLLFSAVNLARFLDAKPAEELHKANQRFRNRFVRLEALVRDSGRVMQDCSLEELDKVWEQIKAS